MNLFAAVFSSIISFQVWILRLYLYVSDKNSNYLPDMRQFHKSDIKHLRHLLVNYKLFKNQNKMPYGTQLAYKNQTGI